MMRDVHFGPEVALPVLLPVAGAELAHDGDLRAAPEEVRDAADLSAVLAALVHDVVPLGCFVDASRAVDPATVGRHPERGSLSAVLARAYLAVVAEVADEVHLIQRAH